MLCGREHGVDGGGVPLYGKAGDGPFKTSRCAVNNVYVFSDFNVKVSPDERHVLESRSLVHYSMRRVIHLSWLVDE